MFHDSSRQFIYRQFSNILMSMFNSQIEKLKKHLLKTILCEELHECHGSGPPELVNIEGRFIYMQVY